MIKGSWVHSDHTYRHYSNINIIYRITEKYTFWRTSRNVYSICFLIECKLAIQTFHHILVWSTIFGIFSLMVFCPYLLCSMTSSKSKGHGWWWPYLLLVQWLEHPPSNQTVQGSNPTLECLLSKFLKRSKFALGTHS